MKNLSETLILGLSEYAAIVYPFENAPKEFQELSQNGGDEDYVIIGPESEDSFWSLPENIAERLLVCNFSVYEYKGRKVYITCHA